MYPHRQPRHRMRVVASVAVAASLALSACGDDDADADASSDTTTAATDADTTTPPLSGPPTTDAPGTDAPGTTGAGGDEFCAIATELNEMDGFPTIEQVEEYAAAAPAEIEEPVGVLLELLRAADGDFITVFSDEAGGAALEQITAVEAELCGIVQGGGPDDGPPQDPSVTVLDPAATRVDVSAEDYAFHGEMPAAAGRYSFVMTNDGAEPHIMILVRLEDGATIDQVLQSEGAEGLAEEFESAPAMPGEQGVLTADLGPGTWVLLCPIPDPGGTPHFASGMIHQFEVS